MALSCPIPDSLVSSEDRYSKNSHPNPMSESPPRPRHFKDHASAATSEDAQSTKTHDSPLSPEWRALSWRSLILQRNQRSLIHAFNWAGGLVCNSSISGWKGAKTNWRPAFRAAVVAGAKVVAAREAKTFPLSPEFSQSERQPQSRHEASRKTDHPPRNLRERIQAGGGCRGR